MYSLLCSWSGFAHGARLDPLVHLLEGGAQQSRLRLAVALLYPGVYKVPCNLIFFPTLI